VRPADVMVDVCEGGDETPVEVRPEVDGRHRLLPCQHSPTLTLPGQGFGRRGLLRVWVASCRHSGET